MKYATLVNPHITICPPRRYVNPIDTIYVKRRHVAETDASKIVVVEIIPIPSKNAKYFGKESDGRFRILAALSPSVLVAPMPKRLASRLPHMPPGPQNEYTATALPEGI